MGGWLLVVGFWFDGCAGKKLGTLGLWLLARESCRRKTFGCEPSEYHQLPRVLTRGLKVYGVSVP